MQLTSLEGVILTALITAVVGVLSWGLRQIILTRQHTEAKLDKLDLALRGYDGEGGILHDLRAIRQHNQVSASHAMDLAYRHYHLADWARVAGDKIDVPYIPPKERAS